MTSKAKGRTAVGFGGCSIRLGRGSDHDVEPGRQLADLRLLDLGEVHRDRRQGLRVADALVDAVLLIAGVTLDVALGDEQLLLRLLDLEVNVRRPPGVRDRLDGPEVVLAGRAG